MASSVIKKGTSIKFESDWFVVNANAWYHCSLPSGMFIEEIDQFRFDCQQNAARYFTNIVPNYTGESSYVNVYNEESVQIAVRFYIIH